MAKTTAKKVVKPAAKKPAAKPVATPAPKAAAPKPVLAVKAPKPYKPVKLPAGYKPAEKEEYMNAQQLEYFRQKLLNWRKELMDESRETLDHLHEENWHQADIADRASLETEAGVELRTRNRYLKLISKIDAAVRRIEEGEYGYCEDTGDEIGLKRLEARPVVTRTTEAQERYERAEKQYSDED
jgi:DnaK suppressor protein